MGNMMFLPKRWSQALYLTMCTLFTCAIATPSLILPLTGEALTAEERQTSFHADDGGCSSVVA